jgi:hypothetical protein
VRLCSQRRSGRLCGRVLVLVRGKSSIPAFWRRKARVTGRGIPPTVSNIQADLDLHARGSRDFKQVDYLLDSARIGNRAASEPQHTFPASDVRFSDYLK